MPMNTPIPVAAKRMVPLGTCEIISHGKRFVCECGRTQYTRFPNDRYKCECGLLFTLKVVNEAPLTPFVDEAVQQTSSSWAAMSAIFTVMRDCP